jgi:tripartite-type tricarboxylate transporter receptor subunit TctC
VGGAQTYPTKPIRIVTGSPGGSTDLVARQIASGLSESWGQPVIVDNREGIIPAVTVAKAPPDGYTLVMDGGSFWITPLLEKLPYDPVKDFEPVAMVGLTINIVAVHPSVAVASISDLIAVAKAKPGSINFASAGVGGGAHLAGELFKAMSGVNIIHVPYKGSGPALNAAISGEVQMIVTSAPPALPHVKSGKLKALAVTSAQPSALAPGLPPVAAAGLPGYLAVQYLAAFAPAKTPAELITRLNMEIARTMRRPSVKDRLFSAGMEVPGGSPQEVGEIIKSEMAKWGKLIKDANIRIN